MIDTCQKDTVRVDDLNKIKNITPHNKFALANLLRQEDTNGDEQITVEDAGPKVFCLTTENSNGYRQVPIRGAYQLANLLQELAIAQENDRKYITLSAERLNEPPVIRLARRIGENFWDSLTRRIDEQGNRIY